MPDRYDPSSHIHVEPHLDIDPPAPAREELSAKGSEFPAPPPSRMNFNAEPLRADNEGAQPVRPALPPSPEEQSPFARGSLNPVHTITKKKNKLPFAWLFAQFIASLLTQIADIVAPLLLVLGGAWALVPILARLATDSLNQADPQTKELAVQVISQLPTHVRILGIYWSGFGIVMMAFFLIVLSSLSVVWQAYLNKKYT
ncbi:hypothetical protein FAI40_02110 [Acetobacteraceae bacterium]|nr:hypothetical protein FAI40_02110 [Acetobacteraceae bacterium]